ncbi:MAG: hypothetical protein J0I12_26770 [Candidatus Eremiobacteraeota bacterium]|nr:hypothetical protein [Candidatus Eremiobacteraeota bacterium]
MKILHAVLFLTLTLTGLAQDPNQLLSNPKLKAYNWKSQIQIAVSGQVKTTVVQQITWTPTGEQQRLELSRTNAEQKKPLIPMRRLLAKRKATKSKEWFQGLQQQLARYQKLPDLKGKTSMDMANGQAVLSAQDVVQSGDKLTVFVDPKTRQPLQGEVVTQYDDSDVKIHLTFSPLEPGLSTVTKTVCEVPEHDVTITVTNSGYSKGT